MDDFWIRLCEDLVARISGPMHLRVFLQPTMAAGFAILAGLRDARAGNPPYAWSAFTHPGHRAELLRNGWKDVGKVYLLAVALDVVYQYIATRFVYPGETLLVAFLLAFVPYLVIRSITNRLARLVGLVRVRSAS